MDLWHLKRRCFKIFEFENVLNNQKGLYAIWFNKKCLYIGKSNNIKQRLTRHWANCHNKDLKLWIQAKNNLEFCYKPYNCNADLSQEEYKYIEKYKPITNILGN